MAITDVFFDLDHTLWDFERNSAMAFYAVLSDYCHGIDHEQFLKFYVPINVKYWELYRVDAIDQAGLRYGRLKETFDAIEYSVSDQTIGLIADAYIENLPRHIHLFEGAIEILDYLAPRYYLHIITNGFHQIQESKLRNSGIFDYFRTITNSETAGVKKPNPLIFESAMRIAGTSAGASVMIGDCIDADVKGALKCGMDAIHFCELRNTPPPIKSVGKLTDLKKFL